MSLLKLNPDNEVVSVVGLVVPFGVELQATANTKASSNPVINKNDQGLFTMSIPRLNSFYFTGSLTAFIPAI